VNDLYSDVQTHVPTEALPANFRRKEAGMLLDAKLKRRLQQLLSVVDEHETHGPRLLDDAQRLSARVRSFIRMKLAEDVDADALELACYAIQLPMRHIKAVFTGKLGRTNLRDRCEQAAELLLGSLGHETDEDLLDRTSRILQEMPHRNPMVDEAKLLADAVNLDDFGLVGLILQTIHLTRLGDGLSQVAEGLEKRDQYGYWEARLKDGFHFPQVRQIAKRRLDHARHAAKLLTSEMDEDNHH
jgi:hypothetical protein